MRGRRRQLITVACGAGAGLLAGSAPPERALDTYDLARFTP